MKTLRVQQTIKKSGEIYLRNLPVIEGQEVEVIVLFSANTQSKKILTARQLLNSDLIGLWQDRSDITDSMAYARKLREQAQRRGYDSPR